MTHVTFADAVGNDTQTVQAVIEKELDHDRHTAVASSDLDVPSGGAYLGGRRKRKRGRGLLGGRKRSRSRSHKRKGSKGAWQRVMKAAVKAAAKKYKRGRH